MYLLWSLYNCVKGGLWFFVSFRIFFSDNTRVRIFIFFVAQFFQEFNVIWQKLWISFFFFLHQNQNIFFSNICLEKNPLQVKWSFPNWFPTLKNFYRLPFSKWPPQYRTNSTLFDFNEISYVGRLWCPELIPDIEQFLPVAIFKMATTIPKIQHCSIS